MAIVQQLSTAFSHTGDDAAGTEWGQAVVRLVIGSAAGVYVLFRLSTPEVEDSMHPVVRLGLFAYVGLFFVVATWMMRSIRKAPGHVPWRRLMAMALDYISLGLMLVMGGETMAPLTAIVISATVGYGVRYGPGYLAVATLIAGSMLLAVVLMSPYWRGNPSAFILVAVLLISAPVYAMSLLRQSEQARQALVTATVAKSRFLAHASHDLRQPLHAIGMFVTSLRQTGLGSSQLAIVDRIDRSLQGVAHLFRSLLDIATLDSGAVSPKPEAVALCDLFDTLLANHGPAARWAGIDLRIVTSSATVTCDRALLLTMTGNLLDNALKHGGGRRVILGCKRSKGLLSVFVRDDGVGIDQAHLPRIREEFYRITPHAGRDLQGVGLGLAIADRLASICGLSLQIRSWPGKGTLASIGGLAAGPQKGVAPVLHSTPADPSRGMVEGADQSAFAGLRIVLIEDDPDLLAATTELLSGWRCIVQPFSTAPRSVEPCDIILTDMDIGGGKTGLDSIAMIRASAWHPPGGAPIPAIVLSGHGTARSLPPRVVMLAKPASAADIHRTMVALLELNRVPPP